MCQAIVQALLRQTGTISAQSEKPIERRQQWRGRRATEGVARHERGAKDREGEERRDRTPHDLQRDEPIRCRCGINLNIPLHDNMFSQTRATAVGFADRLNERTVGGRFG